QKDICLMLSLQDFMLGEIMEGGKYDRIPQNTDDLQTRSRYKLQNIVRGKFFYTRIRVPER
ncbi:unnamed protein product, partial [marine sediment metagenome]